MTTTQTQTVTQTTTSVSTSVCPLPGGNGPHGVLDGYTLYGSNMGDGLPLVGDIVQSKGDPVNCALTCDTLSGCGGFNWNAIDNLCQFFQYTPGDCGNWVYTAGVLLGLKGGPDASGS